MPGVKRSPEEIAKERTERIERNSLTTAKSLLTTAKLLAETGAMAKASAMAHQAGELLGRLAPADAKAFE